MLPRQRAAVLQVKIFFFNLANNISDGFGGIRQ
jgi:hypothetical protein